MATIKQKIEEDLKQALLSKDTLKVDTLRLIKSSILNEEISKGKRESGLSDDESIACLQREAKKRAEAAEMYRKNNAEDRADKEEQEKQIIQEYLPEAMSEEELTKVINEVISENGGEVTPQTMGKIIQDVRTKVGAKAQGGDIARIVKQGMNK